MKKIVLLIVFFAMGLSAFGQGEALSTTFSNRLLLANEQIKRFNKGLSYKDTKSYKGTPYNHPNYLLGSVYEDGKLWVSNVAIRYNAMADEMEIKESLETDDSEAKVLTKSPDVFVKIMNDIYVFTPFQGGVEGGGYFLVLHEGNQVDLFKKTAKQFIPAKKAKTSLTKDLPAVFKDRPIYYMVTKKGVFYEFPSSKKGKLKVFGKNKDAVKSYVRENVLDINKEKDLLKVIKYVNTL